MPILFFAIRSAIIGGISYMVLDKSNQPLTKVENITRYLMLGGVVYAVYQVAKKG